MIATRHVVVTGAALVGAAATATSAVTLYRLAETCGIASPYAAALPIALDAGAAVASLAWITESGPVKTWGRGIAIAALLGTVAGNGVQHGITEGLLLVNLPLVLLVGASIPAMLWATIHLTALLFRPAKKPAEAVVPAAPPVETRPAPVKSKPPAPRQPKRRPRDEVGTRRARHSDRLTFAQGLPGDLNYTQRRDAIAERFGVHVRTADRVLADLKVAR